MSDRPSFYAINGPEGGRWCVPEPDSYAHACSKGREYAAEFITWLHCHPEAGVALRLIAADMDLADQTASKGYQVGFYEFLEDALRIAAKSPKLGSIAQQRKTQSQYLDAILKGAKGA